MGISHPHILQLMAVDVDPLSNQCSIILKFMWNGNIKDYIKDDTADVDRFLLV